MARRLGRPASTIARELRRNESTRIFRLEYQASTAQWNVERRVRRPKLAVNTRLCQHGQDRPVGMIDAPGGQPLHGPAGHAGMEGTQRAAVAGPVADDGVEPQQIGNRLWSLTCIYKPR
ncbi:helix-turn-helix domain-containing protein [Streptomyces sp. ISL-86]|uniref:helix-turn-helix domain-containing protein n=1 Tax=Streptomyces sp. ISL-86 TaxID=2819187 RepID=UPI001BE92C52|nr:hypothetical protein [Streptomyces sp. ISL-86]